MRRLYKERVELCKLVDLMDFLHDPDAVVEPPPPPPPALLEEDQAQEGKQVKSCFPLGKKNGADGEKKEGESEGEGEEKTEEEKKQDEEAERMRRASLADAQFTAGSQKSGGGTGAAEKSAPPKNESEFQKRHRLKQREQVKNGLFEEHGCATEDELADVRDRLQDVWEVPNDAAMQARMERLYDEEARARLAYCDFVDPKMASKLRGRLERKEEALARAQEVLEMRKKQRARARYLAEQRRLKWGENKLEGNAEVGQGRLGQGCRKPTPTRIPNLLNRTPTYRLSHPPAHQPFEPPTHQAAQSPT